jgi:hypothetical protein
LDSMEQEVMTPMTNKGKAMLKYMSLPEPYNSYLSDDICEIEAEMLSLVPDVVSLNDAYQQGLRDARVAVEGTLGRDAMRLLDSVLDWYGNSKGRVVPELEYANRWRLANAADIDAILAALPAPRPPEQDRTALVCSGCHKDVDPSKGMLVHCDACTATALQRTLDAKAEPPAPRPPEPDRTAALVGPVTVAVVDALMAEEIGAGHYRWQVMNIVRPAIVAALAPTPDEAP